MPLPIQNTIRYKTYLKMSIVEALEAAFKDHPDPLLKDTKVKLENSFLESDYPFIVVNYHGQEIKDAGIGHHERGFDETTQRWYKRRRKHYHGTIQLTISALSSLDRDLISDALVETLMMPTIHAYTNYFLLRIYRQELFESTQSLPAGALGTAHYYNLMNLANQKLSESGDSATPAPWGAEDVLVYQTSYSMGIFGEVISLPPDVLYNLLSDVNFYPYVGGVEAIPIGTPDPAPWLSGNE